MEGQKFLKVVSLLLIAVAVLSIAGGVFGFLNLNIDKGDVTALLMGQKGVLEDVQKNLEGRKANLIAASEDLQSRADAALAEKEVLMGKKTNLEGRANDLLARKNDLMSRGAWLLEAQAGFQARADALYAEKDRIDARNAQIDELKKTASISERIKLDAEKAQLLLDTLKLLQPKNQLESEVEEFQTKNAAVIKQISDEKAALEAEAATKVPQMEAEKAQLLAAAASLQARADSMGREKFVLENTKVQLQYEKAVLLKDAAKLGLVADGATKTIMGRLFAILAVTVFGIIAIIPGFIGKSVSSAPSVGKIKASIILGFFALLAALASAYVNFFMASVSALSILAVAITAGAAVLFIIGIFKFKNALVALMAS